MFLQPLKDLTFAARYFVTRYPRPTALALIGSIALALLEMASAAMILPLLSLGMNAAPDSRLMSILKGAFETVGLSMAFTTVLSLFVGFYLVKVLAELVISIYVDYVKITIERDLRRRVIVGLQDVSWPYLSRIRHGMIVNLMTHEVSNAASMFALLQAAVIGLLMFIAYLCLGVAVSPELLVGAAILGGAAVLAAAPLFDMARRAGGNQVVHLRELAAALQAGLMALKSYKAMGREKQLLATLAAPNRGYMAAQKLGARSQQFMTASQQVVMVLGIGAGGWAGHVILGMGLDQIGFLAVLLFRMSGHVSRVLAKLQAVTGKRKKLEKFDDLCAEIGQHVEPKRGGLEPAYPAPIVFEDVTFRHEDRAILDGVNLTIPCAGMTTIIGASGSGKTTLLDLLCGFQSPDRGRILIGEVDLQSLELRKWRRMIGYVTQEPNLISGTIRANVTAFDETISDSDIAEALKMAGVWPFVASMPMGLETNIGEAGGRISGGERQRLSIARALARKPKILILDEPTAAVDAASEAEIMKTLTALKNEIPILAISHQPALAQAADVVYSLSNGTLRLWRHGDQTLAKAAGGSARLT